MVTTDQPWLFCCAGEGPAEAQPDAGTCTEVVSAEKLIQLLHERAQAAVNAGSSVRAAPVSVRPQCHCLVGILLL